MLLSKKEFLDFYNTEMDFASIRGIIMSEEHHEELEAMHKIYSNSRNNKDFTEKMTNAGYGKIK